MRSSGRIRKAIVRFGDELEKDNLKDHYDTTTNNPMNPNMDNGRRTSSRTHKRPRTLEDDYNDHQNMESKQSATTTTHTQKKMPKGQPRSKKKGSDTDTTRSMIPKKKTCTTKTGLKYVVKVRYF